MQKISIFGRKYYRRIGTFWYFQIKSITFILNTNVSNSSDTRSVNIQYKDWTSNNYFFLTLFICLNIIQFYICIHLIRKNWVFYY